MKKRLFITALLVVVTVVALVCLATACDNVTTHTHEFGNLRWLTKPTLTQSGVAQEICSCGQTQEQSVPALSDTSVWQVTEHAATCTQAGYADYTSQYITIQVKTSDPLPHAYGDWTIEVEPTVESMGLAKHGCTREGCSAMEGVSIPVLIDNSVWTATVVDGDCDHEGTIAYTSVYGTVKVATPKAAHEWQDWTMSQQPTLTTAGTRVRDCKNCEEQQTASIPALSDKSVWRMAVTTPTCERDGEQVYTSVYGTVRVALPGPDGHDYAQWTMTTIPTIETAGSAQGVCKACGERTTVTVPALGDTGVWSVDSKLSLAPTCTTAGYTLYVSIYGQARVPVGVRAHNYIDWVLDVNPTLTDGGTVLGACEYCDDIVSRPVAALSDTTVWAIDADKHVEATCGDAGADVYTSIYGDVSVAIAPTGNHTYGNWVIDVAPTMDAAGTAIGECGVCGDVADTTIPALTDDTVWTLDANKHVDATCGDEGADVYTSIYGDVSVPVAPTGIHTYGNWVIDVAPTMDAAGTAIGECVHCQEIVEQPIPALTDDTVWTLDANKHVDATCGDEGADVYTSIYGDVSVTIAPTGVHTYGNWIIDVVPTMDTAGTAIGECVHCQEIVEQTVAALNDSTVWTHTHTAPTCVAVGGDVYTSIYGEIRFDEPATGVHTPAAPIKENEVAATCTTAGGWDEVILCGECGEELERTSHTVDALGHVDDNNDYRCDREGCGMFVEKAVTEPADIVAMAYALLNDETTVNSYTLTGVITSIKTAYSEKYNNISVFVQVGDMVDNLIFAYRMTVEAGGSLTADDLRALAVGNEITVTGTFTNFNGTIEFAEGCILNAYSAGTASITVAPVSNATVSAIAPTAENGSTVTFTVEAAAGYKVAAVKVYGTAINPAEDGSYSFVVNGDAVIEVETVDDSVVLPSILGTIDFTVEGQRLSQDNAQQTWQNGSVTFVNEKGTGNNVASYMPIRCYSGSIVTISCTSNMTTIELLCTESKYVPDQTFDGATVTVNGLLVTITLDVPAKEFTFSPAKQLRFESLTVYGIEDTNVYDVTVDEVSAQTADVTLGAVTSGVSGTEFTFEVAPKTNYRVVAVMVNGDVVEAVDGVYTGVINGATVISVETADDTCAITLPTNPNVSVAVVGDKTQANAGETVEFTVTAVGDYVVTEVTTDNGTPVTKNGDTYSFVIGAPTTIVVTTIDKYYNVTITADNATVDGITAGEKAVEYGTTVTFTVTAAEGYEVRNVKINNDTATANEAGEYTVENVTANLDIVVVTGEQGTPDDPSQIRVEFNFANVGWKTSTTALGATAATTGLQSACGNDAHFAGVTACANVYPGTAANQTTPATDGILKFSSSKKAGSITLSFDFNVTQVIINGVAWLKTGGASEGSALAVNGGEAQSLGTTAGDLIFDLATGAQEITIDATKRAVVYSIIVIGTAV